MSLKQGDTISKTGFKRKVLGVCGEIVFLSQRDVFTETTDNYYATQEELRQAGWQFPKEAWMPKHEDTFFYITSEGDIEDSCWVGMVNQQQKKDFLGIYPTEEEAEKALAEIKVKLNK